MEKKNNAKFIFLIVVFTIFFVIGGRALYDNISYDGYQYPIYISEKLSFEKLDTNKYTIKCQFINLTNEDVTIEKLHIYLSGKKDSNHYIYDDQYLYDIKVPAGGKYDLIINDYYYPIEFGGYIKSCIIGGKECNSIQYSPDGVTFKGPTSLLTTIILLSIGIGGNVICIVMMNKNKKQNMNKVSNS